MNSFLSLQYPNFTLWAPFVLSGGAALYFALPFEPVVAYPWLIAILCMVCFGVIFHRRDRFHIAHFVPLAASLLFVFGFFYACTYSRAVQTPTLTHDMHGALVSGTVSAIDYTDTRTRVFITDANLSSPYSANEYHGITVRLSISNDEPAPMIGDKVSASASLFRPAPADAPGGFDMAEWCYFHGIGATGYATESIEYINENLNNSGLSISNLRDKIHRRVAVHKNITATALSDSLMLGFGRALPSADAEFARAAGIAHVFSISGFHITLVGGWLFAVLYFLFRSVPAITRRWPARYPAMICSWIGLVFYLGISGAAVATQRSFIMASLAFAAFIFGRTVFTLRNVCLVFGALVLANPHYVTEAGFQLSFAAIFGLVWFFSGTKFEKLSRWQKIWRGVRALILTDLIATLFTAPFIAYHFHYFPTYSLLGNLLCLPLFSILIMPLILVGTITAQFGFYTPLDLGANIYELTVAITKWISELPLATLPLPPMPGPALAFLVMGFLCLIFIINGRRDKNFRIPLSGSIFAALVTASIILIMAKPHPIFYATHDHELVAFMTDSGTLQFNKGRAANHKMTFGTWDSMNGDTDTTRTRKPIGKGFAGEKYSVECADRACVYTTPKWTLAYIQQFVPLYKNIERLCFGYDSANFIVSYFKIDAPNCAARILNSGFVIYKSGRVEYTPANRIWHK